MAVAACVTWVGCDVGPASPDPVVSPAELAHAKWQNDAWDHLAACRGCHVTMPSLDFFAGGDADTAYTSLFAFQPPVVNIETPAASLLLTMGKHTGPALAPADAAAVLGWLEAERAARVTDAAPPVFAGPVATRDNVMTPLDLGAGGAQLRLTAAPFSSLYLAKIELAAGPTQGVHVTHPLFVAKPAAGGIVLDDLDRFSELDVELDPGETLDLGAEAFLPFGPGDPLTVYFNRLEAR